MKATGLVMRQGKANTIKTWCLGWAGHGRFQDDSMSVKGRVWTSTHPGSWQTVPAALARSRRPGHKTRRLANIGQLLDEEMSSLKPFPMLWDLLTPLLSSSHAFESPCFSYRSPVAQAPLHPTLPQGSSSCQGAPSMLTLMLRVCGYWQF